jgi:hypothetical protein
MLGELFKWAISEGAIVKACPGGTWVQLENC